MTEPISAYIWKAAIPKNPEAAYALFRKDAPSVLKEYDRLVLGRYDIGKEFAYFLKERIHPELGGVTDDEKRYSNICGKVLAEFEAVALRNVMPTLPIERVNASEMHLYAVRNVFTSMLRGAELFMLQKQAGNYVPDQFLKSGFAVLCEVYCVMMRLVRHSKKQSRGQ